MVTRLHRLVKKAKEKGFDARACGYTPSHHRKSKPHCKDCLTVRGGRAAQPVAQAELYRSRVTWP